MNPSEQMKNAFKNIDKKDIPTAVKIAMKVVVIRSLAESMKSKGELVVPEQSFSDVINEASGPNEKSIDVIINSKGEILL